MHGLLHKTTKVSENWAKLCSSCLNRHRDEKVECHEIMRFVNLKERLYIIYDKRFSSMRPRLLNNSVQIDVLFNLINCSKIERALSIRLTQSF